MGKSGPASGASIVTAARTDPGRLRDSNQDAVGEFRHALADRRLLIVADGMGGPAGGDVASKLVVQSVENTFRSSQDDATDLLRRALERANEAVLEVSRKNLELAGMGTTAVMLTSENPKLMRVYSEKIEMQWQV